MSGQIGSRDADRTQLVGTASSGFVHSETQGTVTSVLELQARPRSSGSGCLHSGLVRSHYICLPVISNGREMSIEDQGGESRESSDSDPSMKESSMVPSTPSREHQQSLSSCPLEGSVNEPSGRSAYPHCLGKLTLITWQVSGNPWRVEKYQKAVSLIWPSLKPGLDRTGPEVYRK